MISQLDVLKSSRISVECKCDCCGKYFTKKRVDIHNDLDTHMKNIFNQESATTTRYALVEEQGEDIVWTASII